MGCIIVDTFQRKYAFKYICITDKKQVTIGSKPDYWEDGCKNNVIISVTVWCVNSVAK